MVRKNWKLKDVDSEAVDVLSEALGGNRVLASLLVQRNVRTISEMHDFFSPSYEQLHDPMLMHNMKRAVDCIVQLLHDREKMLIYGDYDVDGTTAVAMVYSFLKKQGGDVSYYIPDRYSEGYGISKQGIDHAYRSGIKWIIALDCGIKANEKVDYAKSKGIEFIICDHHYAGAKLPQAFAILNPKCDDTYPYKELSGCGVGFKLIQALSSALGLPQEEAYEYIDMVAVSVASDIVSMDKENRALTYLGLQKLNTNPSLGLKSILSISKMRKDQKITSDDIVFRIGPRINAAGRMSSGNRAVDLLCGQDERLSRELAREIDEHNTLRKQIDTEITSQALREMSKDPQQESHKSTVLFNPNWHKGVVGIVASRLIDTYYKPTVILTESNGMATGSARSVEGFDLYSAVEACSEYLENFGGHTYAAGVTMKLENIEAFRRKFEEEVSARITPDQLVPSVEIDTEIELSQITPEFCAMLKRFQPFGPSNPAPVFLTPNVYCTNDVRTVGPYGEHLKINVYQIDEDGTKSPVVPAIGFQMGGRVKEVKAGRPFHICYVIEENSYQGNKSYQLRIKDLMAGTLRTITEDLHDETVYDGGF